MPCFDLATGLKRNCFFLSYTSSLVFLILSLFLSSSALATGSLNGSVLDASDGVTAVHPVFISIHDSSDGTELTGALNNPDGSYTIPSLTEGNYLVFFNAIDTANFYIDELYDEVTSCDNGGCDMVSLGNSVILVTGDNTLDESLVLGIEVAGIITETGSATPLGGVTVQLYDGGGGLVQETVTAGDGSYLLRGLAPQNLYVVANGSAVGYQTEIYDDVICPNGDCVSVAGLATQINPPAGTSQVVDFDLEAAGSNLTGISGNVTDSGTGNSVEGVYVQLFDLDCNFWDEAATDSAGDYFIPSPGDGEYYLFSYAPWMNYINEQYPGIQMFDTCLPQLNDVTLGEVIQVIGSPVLSGYDFSLDIGGSISGTVSDSLGLLGENEGQARLHETGTGLQLAVSNTDVDGNYHLGGLLPGDFNVILSSRFKGLIDERYDDVKCPRNSCDSLLGDTITLAAQQNQAGIDAVLDAGSVVSGLLTDSSNGNPIAGYCIAIYNEAGVYSAVGCSDDSGVFSTVTALPDGNYTISNVFDIWGSDYLASPGYLAQVWTSDGSFRACTDPCDKTTGDMFAVSGNTINIDMALVSSSATLSGTIVDSSDGVTAVHPVYISIHDSNDGTELTRALNNPDGSYTIPSLTEGSYLVFFNAIDAANFYIDELYDEIACSEGVCPIGLVGNAVDIALGVNTLNEDLDIGGNISGVISSSVSGQPLGLDEGRARLYALDGTLITTSLTDDTGTYSFAGIPEGSYYVLLTPRFGNLVDELYDDAVCPRLSCDTSAGIEVTVTQGVLITGIDATLDPGSRIGGSIHIDGVPLESGTILMYTAAGAYAGFGRTVGNGDYLSASGFPAGNYYVTLEIEGYVNMAYPNRPCGQPCDPTLGDLVVVDGSNDIGGIDFNSSIVVPGIELNGSFETGDLSDWVPIADGVKSIEVPGFGAQEGSYAAKLTIPATNGVGFLMQTYPASPGDEFHLSGYMLTESPQGDAFGLLKITFQDENGANLAPLSASKGFNDPVYLGIDSLPYLDGSSPNNEWVFSEAQGVAPPGTKTVRAEITYVNFTGVERSVWFDNIQMALLPSLELNGSFEKGELTDWLLVADGVKSVEVPGFGAQEGSYAAKLTIPATNGVGYLMQTYPASPGDEFYLSGYMLTESPQGDAVGLLKITFQDENGVNLAPTFASKGFSGPDFFGIDSLPYLDGSSPSNEWVFSEAQGVAPPGTLTVRAELIYVNFTGIEQSIWFDNVQMALLAPVADTAVIYGTVTADDGGAPLKDINVCVVNKNDSQVDACATTDTLGKYLVGNLAPINDYVVYTRDVGGQAFFAEVYDSVACCDTSAGTSVDLTAGDAMIDFGLAASGRISGFVKDVTTEMGIANAWIWLLDESCERVDVLESYTDDATSPGSYAISGVPDGTYYVYVVGESLGYINELFPDEKRIQPCYGDFPAGQAIVIENNTQVSGIDFALDAGGSIGGFISNADGVLPFRRGLMYLSDDAGGFIKTWVNNQPGSAYLASGLPPGSYQVAFSSNNLGLVDELYDDVPCPRRSCDQSLGVLVDVGPSEQVTGIDATLEPGAVIRGRLTDALTGDGLPSQFIAVYTSEGKYAGIARSNADGFYTTTTGFPPGDYFVSNQRVGDVILEVANGYLPQAWTNDGSFGACGEPCDVLQGDPLNISGTAPVENINMAMEKGSTISGNVQFGGGPLANEPVVLLDELANQLRSVNTDASGNYAFPGLNSGNYYVRTLNGLGYEDRLHAVPTDVICNPNCNPFSGTIISTDGASEFNGIDFVLTIAGSISGTVTGNASAPLAGVTVEAYNVNGNVVGSAITNATGFYMIKGLGNGSHYVRTKNQLGYRNALYSGLSCPAGCDVTTGTAVAVIAGAESVNIDFQLIDGSTLSGSVRFEGNNTPLRGINVEIYSEIGDLAASVTSDFNGNYLASGLDAGNYHMVTRSPVGSAYVDEAADGSICQGGCDPLTTAVVTLGSNEDLQLNFSLGIGAELEIDVVSDSVGTTIGGIQVIVVNQSGNEVKRVTSSVPSRRGVLIRGLAPGDYYVYTQNELGFIDEVFDDIACEGVCDPLQGTRINLSDTGRAFKVISLAGGSSISGHLWESGTSPLEPATTAYAELFKNGGFFRNVQISSVDGSFELSGLPSGEYQLKGYGNGVFVSQYYGDAGTCSPEPCDPAQATPITVTNTDLTGFDMQLSRGGSITGFAYDVDGNVIRSYEVNLYSSTGAFLEQKANSYSCFIVCPDPSLVGKFTFVGLAPGTYYITMKPLFSNDLVSTLYSGILCPGDSCDLTSGTPITVSAPAPGLASGLSSASFLGSRQEASAGNTTISITAPRGHKIRGAVRGYLDAPVKFTDVYFFTESGLYAGDATTDGLGNFVSSTGLPNGSYYAATSRSASPSDTPEEAMDVEDGVGGGLQDQVWTGPGSGISCTGVCAPGPGNGTLIEINDADATGIDFILDRAAGISVEKHTNGIDADTPNGGEAPEIAVGETVSWTYDVTNTGGDELIDIAVVDDQGVTITCPHTSLAADAFMTCTGSEPAQNLALEPFEGVIGNCSGTPNTRLYQNTALVTAQTNGGAPVNDDDTSHYCNPVTKEDLIFESSFE